MTVQDMLGIEGLSASEAFAFFIHVYTAQNIVFESCVYQGDANSLEIHYTLYDIVCSIIFSPEDVLSSKV